MAGRIRIPPYRPLGVSTQAVPGGGYFDVDASAGQFGPSPLLQLGLQAAEGVAGIASVVSEQIGRDDEATVKAADMRLGEAEQALFFDPDNGYLNTQGEAALTRAEVRDKAERHGWDSPLTEAALSQQTSHTLVSAVEAAVERDPGRAQALRTRHDQHIEAPDRAALDALLAEAQTRQRAQAASAEILNAAPPDGEQPTSQWRLRQAEAIPDPDVRAATIRRVRSAAAADEARARAWVSRCWRAC